MQKLIQKNKEEISSKHKSLSIQFSLDGFSFCVKDIPSGEILLLTAYTFESSMDTPHELSEKIQSIFEAEKELQIEFDQIIAIHQNQLATQIPDAYFDENHLKTYLDYNIKTFSSDYITFDNLPSLEAKNVYIPYVNVNNFLFQNFGEFEFKHHSTVLLEQLITNHDASIEDTMYVNVSHKYLDIVVFKKDQLRLYNSFQYNSKEDFLYYILFVSEQLELDPSEFQLLFSGNITKDFTNFTLTKEYIKNVDFLKPSYNFLDESEHFKPHSNYILLS
ncbi:conserved hypothetical protein [Tenacibaculum sp. 190524A05c]|uniref:DUF3822 family protein n=1 Tax=Tenacibaculum platacis TaxID=3137852 RepID=UPI0031FA5812